jgi:hypothetical protein
MTGFSRLHTTSAEMADGAGKYVGILQEKCRGMREVGLENESG